MNFLYQITENAFLTVIFFSKWFLGLCYIKRCCLLPPVVSYRLNCFLMVKNVGDLERNFITQTFASSHLFLPMIFDESSWKRLIASERNLLFLAKISQTIFQFRQTRTVDIIWIPAHCGITLHDRADFLATQANNQITRSFLGQVALQP